MPIWVPLHLDKPPINESALKEIGRVMVLWARFENALYTDIISLLRIVERERIEAKLPREMPLSFTECPRLR